MDLKNSCGSNMKRVKEELYFSNNLRTIGQSGLQLKKGSCLWIGLQYVLGKVWVTRTACF